MRVGCAVARVPEVLFFGCVFTAHCWPVSFDAKVRLKLNLLLRYFLLVLAQHPFLLMLRQHHFLISCEVVDQRLDVHRQLSVVLTFR